MEKLWGAAHLLHHVQLGVLRLKKLDKQLQYLGVQELVAGADLWTPRRASLRCHLLSGLTSRTQEYKELSHPPKVAYC